MAGSARVSVKWDLFAPKATRESLVEGRDEFLPVVGDEDREARPRYCSPAAFSALFSSKSSWTTTLSATR